MSRTALIVDDALFIRSLLRSILEMSGYTVVAEAADGGEAVEKYREHAPDVTIMDIVMPLKNGITASIEILSHDEKANIVICSSYGSEEELKNAALMSGAKGVITKPFTAEKVREVVDGVLAEASPPLITEQVAPLP
ncbi:chemotaxis protein CheY [Geobacter sp. OR-1]|uniref:response regulator n=1 Tax=Geobacter sp. OR-1 TaxID=1266765 RepID=UPI0005439AED|nr:response regulator [Geobacter sp. OR-1]GAM10092.1 chemotaxis protein CheY [Geobacter sp. OR-1]